MPFLLLRSFSLVSVPFVSVYGLPVPRRRAAAVPLFFPFFFPSGSLGGWSLSFFFWESVPLIFLTPEQRIMGESLLRNSSPPLPHKFSDIYNLFLSRSSLLPFPSYGSKNFLRTLPECFSFQKLFPLRGTPPSPSSPVSEPPFSKGGLWRPTPKTPKTTPTPPPPPTNPTKLRDSPTRLCFSQ